MKVHTLVVAGLLALVLASAVGAQPQPACLVAVGRTLYRVNAWGNGTVEVFPGQPGVAIGMTLAGR